MDRLFLVIDVDRRGYGWRYRSLPVDAISRTELLIDVGTGLLRPEMIDLRPGDLVRWRHEGHQIQAQIAHVQRDASTLRATLADATLLPGDYFNP